MQQRDGTWATLVSQDHPVGAIPLMIVGRPAWMPNPFSDRSYLVYKLSDHASRARLRVFTTSGREILDDGMLPSLKGTRHYVWDGRDADGDAVANGLYFYELALWDEHGKQADRRLDKIVRVR